MIRIGLKTATSLTVNANDRDCGGSSDATMGGLVTQRCDLCDYNGIGDAGTVYADINITCP